MGHGETEAVSLGDRQYQRYLHQVKVECGIYNGWCYAWDILMVACGWLSFSSLLFFHHFRFTILLPGLVWFHLSSYLLCFEEGSNDYVENRFTWKGIDLLLSKCYRSFISCCLAWAWKDNTVPELNLLLPWHVKFVLYWQTERSWRFPSRFFSWDRKKAVFCVIQETLADETEFTV